MFELNYMELLYVTCIIAVGSASQAAIGMGLNLFAIPLLLLINPIYAPGPVLVASFALSFLALWRVPAKVDRNELNLAVIGLIVGTCLAGAVTFIIDSGQLSRVLGVAVVIGVGLALSGWSFSINRKNLIAAGGGAGFLGTIAGVHAPPIALLYQGLEPDRIRGAILTFVGIGNLFSIIALVVVGQFGTKQIIVTMLMIPGVAIGLWFAPILAKLVSARLLRILVLMISAASGALLIVG